MINEHTPDYSIIPPTGAKGIAWPSGINITQGIRGSLSQAGWEEGHEGYQQQTFLGASIRNFNVTAGFGDSSSNISIQLVEDEYNKSDESPLGVGDDPYHAGKKDKFIAPPVGSPVFFKFGKTFATVEQAWRRTIDETYGISSLEALEFDEVEQSGLFVQMPSGVDEMPKIKDQYYLREEDKGNPDIDTDDIRTFVNKKELFEHDNKDRGSSHFSFGGILQSSVENRSPAGNPLYTVQLTDPREILSNCSVILNDYAGTTFNSKNIFNVYGFLEYDPSDKLQERFDNEKFYKWILEKRTDNKGLVSYVGVDEDLADPLEISFFNGSFKTLRVNPSVTNYDLYKFENPLTTGALGKVLKGSDLPKYFPVTGEGFSRRSEQGIPWYRVSQALTAMFEEYGTLPQEYKSAGFGNQIDFRGFNYIVDFGGIPLNKIPKTYFLDYNQIDLLSLVLELCDVISHDLFVSLLPVIDPLVSPVEEEDERGALMNMAFAKNSYHIKRGEKEKMIHGIIRLDAIDKSAQPSYGSIQRYINKLEDAGISVENRELGFELSNVVTDKFIAGAQEVEMYYFSTYKDRDSLEYRKKINGVPNSLDVVNKEQWTLGASLRQQVLPFYGFLGKKAVSIPRGFGSFQQIMLDTQSLEAYGVGNYYIATEIELRAAAVSYEQWTNFLETYNETYVQEIGEFQSFYRGLAGKTSEEIPGLNDQDDDGSFNIENLKNREFGVGVPRCVFSSDKNFMGPDGYPASPCAPPYGYPLYYKRAEKIGTLGCGVAKIENAINNIITSVEKIKQYAKSDPSNNFLALEFQKVNDVIAITNEKFPYGPNYESYGEATACMKEKLIEIQNSMDDMEAAGEYIPIIENILEVNQKYKKTLQKTARRGADNAKKIHSFLKKVADENLGKKYLVKMPKYCNVNYSEQIQLKTHLSTDEDNNITDNTHSVKEIYSGPFGFRPIPVSESGISVLQAQETIFDFNRIRQSELFPPPPWSYEKFVYKEPSQETYSYGALKGNFNPMSERWAFNYKPEDQGGFFNFSLYSRNLSLSEIENASVKGKNLPYVTQNQLAPKNLTNFVGENGRISCYVRYDNSQYLDMRGINPNEFAQELVTVNGNIPDLMEDLDNVNTDNVNTFSQAAALQSGDEELKDTVAYVKCSVESELYMPPKVSTSKNLVYGRDIKFVPNITQLDILETTDEDGCPTWKCFQPYAEPIFTLTNTYTTNGIFVGEEPLPANRYGVSLPYGKPFRKIRGGGSDGTIVTIEDFTKNYNKDTDSFIFDTEEQNLDSDHVYALVTIPGRIKTTLTQRYMDSQKESINGLALKHLETQDVVRGPIGFDEPAPIINDKTGLDCSKFTFEELESVVEDYRNLVNNVVSSNPNLKYTLNEPSPVIPNLFALPLMSTERCYGPWLSSSKLDDSKTRYRDIGGKIEFVKDENLAPWNYAGYQLMDEAGKLQAEFSNSLLLFSERGGFTFPAAPGAISIGKQLENAGPLVTSINISVQDNAISTTVKMDLYTSRFGKLQKQKEGAIAQIARERQRSTDQNNEMIRNGLIRNASANNPFELSRYGTFFQDLNSDLSEVEKGNLNLALVLGTAPNDTVGTDLATDQELEDKASSIIASHEAKNGAIDTTTNWQAHFLDWASTVREEPQVEKTPATMTPDPINPSPDYIDRDATLEQMIQVEFKDIF